MISSRIFACFGSRGSVLLMTLILSLFLSVFLMLATDTLLLGMKSQRFTESSMELFYLAEAGLAHGQAFCRSERGEAFFLAKRNGSLTEDDEKDPAFPFDHWIPWGEGNYLLTVRVPTEKDPASIFLERDSGILLRVRATLGVNQTKSLILLMEEPPSCRTLAWWEPESQCENG